MTIHLHVVADGSRTLAVEAIGPVVVSGTTATLAEEARVATETAIPAAPETMTNATAAVETTEAEVALRSDIN